MGICSSCAHRPLCRDVTPAIAKCSGFDPVFNAIKTAMDKNYDGIVKYLRFPPNSVTGSYKNADFLAAFHMALHRE